MEKEKYQLAKELTEKIERAEKYIREINLLLKSCNLDITIQGFPAHRTTQVVYRSINKDYVIKLLEADLIYHNSKLESLKSDFEKL